MRYLLISFYRKPGGQIDEQARFVKRVRTSDSSTSNIIMDYGLRKVEKCAQLEKEGPALAKQRETKI